MTPISKQEHVFIERILVRLPVRARANYLDYQRTDGFLPRTADDFSIIASLYRKGWLKESSDMVNPTPVWLTHEAWSRFALDEWIEVEEAVLEAKRGEDFGSW